jgi:chromate transporter
MAETTPGPLIQIVQFVGFLGGYKREFAQHHDVGPALQAGLIGSLIVNWVTYLPCFLWIFLGAPYIERLRGQQEFSCALSGITAAVVGVILNLAVWFSLKALFGPLTNVNWGPLMLHVPQWSVSSDVAVRFSWATLLLAIAAAVALFRYRRGVMEVLLAAVMLGTILHAAGAR